MKNKARAKVNLSDLKKIPLYKVCLDHLGYYVDMKHDTQRWRTLVSPLGQKILTSAEPTDDVYFFKALNSNFSGTIVDLLIKVHNFSYKEIFHFAKTQLLKSDLLPLPPSSSKKSFFKYDFELYPQESSKEILDFFARRKKVDFLKDNFLIKKGFKEDVLKFFDVSASKTSVSFPLYRLTTEDKLIYQSYITYHQFKYFFAKGFSRLDSFSLLYDKNYDLKDFSTMHLFESPIDALSFAQLNGPSKTLYLSTCGSLTNDFLSSLPILYKRLGLEKIFICFDNDIYGSKMKSQVLNFLDLFHEVLLPEEKDWFEDLSKQNISTH